MSLVLFAFTATLIVLSALTVLTAILLIIGLQVVSFQFNFDVKPWAFYLHVYSYTVIEINSKQPGNETQEIEFT